MHIVNEKKNGNKFPLHLVYYHHLIQYKFIELLVLKPRI